MKQSIGFALDPALRYSYARLLRLSRFKAIYSPLRCAGAYRYTIGLPISLLIFTVMDPAAMSVAGYSPALPLTRLEFEALAKGRIRLPHNTKSFLESIDRTVIKSNTRPSGKWVDWDIQVSPPSIR